MSKSPRKKWRMDPSTQHDVNVTPQGRSKPDWQVGPGKVDPSMKHQEYLEAVRQCCEHNSGVFVTCYKIKGENTFIFEDTLLTLPSGFSDPDQREDFFRFMQIAADVFEQMNGRGRKPTG